MSPAKAGSFSTAFQCLGIGSNWVQEWGRVRGLWKANSGITLQGRRDWRQRTFGSHYRTKGQGARKQSESGSEVPDSPTGAVVNLHISTQEGASLSCLPVVDVGQQ